MPPWRLLTPGVPWHPTGRHTAPPATQCHCLIRAGEGESPPPPPGERPSLCSQEGAAAACTNPRAKRQLPAGCGHPCGPGAGGAGARGMGSVGSYIGDLGVAGRAGAERPPARVWGPLAARRYGVQDTSQATSQAGQGAGAGAGPGAGSSAMPSLSQNSVDLSQN
ncbi:unnamed protein product [Pylaiella littoralis]